MPKKGYKQTILHKENIGKSMKGYHPKTEFKKGQPPTKGSFKKGHKTNVGKHWKIKDISTREGNKNHNWKDGNSQTYTMKQLKKSASRPKPLQCEICGAMGKICFDHNHRTGKFRGWICNRCNWTLGHVKDSPELLERLSKYLRNHS